VPSAEALATLGADQGAYDPALLKVLSTVAADADGEEVRGVMLVELRPGMVLASDVRSLEDVLLVTGGQEVTASLISRLKNFATMEEGVAEPVMVRGVR
jgi:hypothetical protein